MPRRFTGETLRRLNPRTRTLTSFRRNEELEVALDIHRRLPILDFDAGGDNPWAIEYARLFDSHGDSDKFRRREDLEPDGWTLGRDKVFRRGIEMMLPLYEGQLVDRYDHRVKTYEGYSGAKKYGRKPFLPRTTDEQKANPAFENEPRYWMDAGVVRARLEARVGERAMFAFRDVGAPWRNQRSAKGALIPPRPATHKLPIICVDHERAFEFAAVFNSAIFDFLVRGHMPGGSVALVWMLGQIPAPLPGLDPRIAANAASLSLTSQSIAEVFNTGVHRWKPSERHRLDVETDALVAHAYGVDREGYEIALDSFELMGREQVKQHGSYRIKEDCLDAFDRFAAARPLVREVARGPA